jgi:hypothetical protein
MNSFITPVLSKHYDPDLIHETHYNNISRNNPRTKKIITVYDMTYEFYKNVLK